MTEEEAKTKACCKGSDAPIMHNGSCIGSECMAWRWSVVIGLPQNISPISKKHGYCGLAGDAWTASEMRPVE